MANVPIISFNAGELSPQIDARIDVEKYGSGCRHLENMIPLIYGGVERRPGTKFIWRKMPFYGENIERLACHENDVLGYENDALFDKQTNKDVIPEVFASMLFYENDLMAFEGLGCTYEEVIYHNVDILFYENSVLCWENEVLTYSE